MLKLAKPAMDVGLYTNNLDACLEFWQSLPEVTYSELLKLGGGAHQHRHAFGDSVIKLNHRRQPVSDAAPSGMQLLTLHSPRAAENLLTDPDGSRCRTTAEQSEQIHLTLSLAVADVQRSAQFYGEILQLEQASQNRFKVGASTIELVSAEVAPDPEHPRDALGLRYITLQVFDVVGVHSDVLARGGREGLAPVRLGEVAYISFVRDPDGHWIEISQRKSITGSLE